MRHSILAIAIATSFSLLACSGAPSSSEPASNSSEEALRATPPLPAFLQYVGEYDADASGHFDWIDFHANGRFEASVDGRYATGAYSAPSTWQSPAVLAFKVRAVDYYAGIHTSWNGGPVPAQVQIVVGTSKAAVVSTSPAAVDGSDPSMEVLRAPWIAGGESICDATSGSWTDDDADPSTGLFCLCPAPKAYIPSAGGCVALGAHNGDPARIPPGASAMKSVGEWDGNGRMAWIELDSDGTWFASIDGVQDWGTFWGGGQVGKTTSTAIVFAGVSHGFTGVVPQDGSKMTIEWDRTSAEDVTPAK